MVKPPMNNTLTEAIQYLDAAFVQYRAFAGEFDSSDLTRGYGRWGEEMGFNGEVGVQVVNQFLAKAGFNGRSVREEIDVTFFDTLNGCPIPRRPEEVLRIFKNTHVEQV